MPDFDLAAANKLLDEAGYKADSSGVRFTIRHMPLPYGEVWDTSVGIFPRLDAEDRHRCHHGDDRRRRSCRQDGELGITTTSANFVYQVGDANIGMEQYFASENIRKVAFNMSVDTKTSGLMSF